MDLTGATAVDFFVTRSAFKAEADHDLALRLAAGVVVIDALAGLVEITLSAALSAALEPYGEFFYFLRATLAGGEVVLPDLLRGSFWNDLTSALNQAANGDCLVRLDPPTGEIAAITPDMANYLLNRYDLMGLTGGQSTKLDALSSATLAAMPNGTQIELFFTGSISAKFRLRARNTGETEVGPSLGGFIIFCDNDTSRCWELCGVTKQGVPCVWNPDTVKWHQQLAAGTGTGVTGALAQEADAFSLPA